MLKNYYDIVVVGAGPGGSITAMHLAKKGFSVALLEKRQEIGAPKRCGEGLPLTADEIIKLGVPDYCKRSEINGAIVVAPNGKAITVNMGKLAGYVVERKALDKWLAFEASRAGAYVQAKTEVTDVIKENGYVVGVKTRYENEEKDIRCKMVVAADGIESTIARKAGLNTTNKLIDVESGFQFEMANVKIDDPMKLQLYFGKDIAPRGYCLTGNSLVLTRDSMKHIEKIKEGEEIHNLLGWTPVSATSKRDYDGKIIKITPSMFNTEIGLTEDHLVYVWNRKNGFVWKKAGELKKGCRNTRGNGDYLLFPIPLEESIQHIDVSSYADGIIDGEYIYPIGRNQFGSVFKYKHKIMNKLVLSTDLMELFGYFVSEGNVNSNGIIISNTNKEIINRVAEIGRNIFGFEPSFWSNKRENECVQVSFSSKILRKTFKELFGEGCRNKRMPRWFLGLNDELKRAFLIGLFRGDGSKEISPTDNYNVLSYISTSKQLIYDLWLLLTSMKIVAAIGYNKKKDAMRLRIRGKQLQNLTDIFGILKHGNTFNRGFFIKDNMIFMNIRKMSKEHYSGLVYDIESGGSFCPGFIVHNCWVFPKGKDIANVGIGIAPSEQSARYYLEKWIESKPEMFKDASIIEVNAGGIPVGGLLENMVLNGFATVGDAAHQVNAIHGGGLHESTTAGRILADVIEKCIKNNDVSQEALSEYNKLWWEERGNRLQKVQKLRELFDKLNDDDMNLIAGSVNGDDLLNLARGSKAVGLGKLLLKNPRLLGLMKHFL